MTAGNRKGLKMYSFNTTVRIPDKNIEHLELFKKYEGRLFDNLEKINYYIDAITRGIVQPKNVNREVREKIRSGYEISTEEINEILKNNKPKNGFGGRVGDFLSAMANQGFIQKQNKRYRLTYLGNELLTNPENETDIYIKSMLKLQYGSIARTTALNKSIPFLNTLFVIDEINKIDGFKYKGISEYELGVFVLTMRDCNYKKCVKEILEYRKKYNNKTDRKFALDFVHNKRGILKIDYATLLGSASYTDDVIRKFKKTGLFKEISHFKNNFYTFSEVEEEKVKLLLKEYENYKWKKFSTVDDYVHSIETVVLPWESDNSLYAQILRKKAEIIGYKENLTNINKNIIDKIEEQYSEYIFQNRFPNDFTYEFIINELEIINGKSKGKTILPDTENYVKLEWFAALLLSKKFGKENVKGNLRFYDDGKPKCCAGGNMPDVRLERDNIRYNIEVTTISNKTQQLNNETTSVLRHLDEQNNNMENTVIEKAIMVAPYVHYDTINIYLISANGISTNTTAIPITIDAFIEAVYNAKDFAEFDNKINEYYKMMKTMTISEYEKMINSIKLENDNVVIN